VLLGETSQDDATHPNAPSNRSAWLLSSVPGRRTVTSTPRLPSPWRPICGTTTPNRRNVTGRGLGTTVSIPTGEGKNFGTAGRAIATRHRQRKSGPSAPLCCVPGFYGDHGHFSGAHSKRAHSRRAWDAPPTPILRFNNILSFGTNRRGQISGYSPTWVFHSGGDNTAGRLFRRQDSPIFFFRHCWGKQTKTARAF